MRAYLRRFPRFHFWLSRLKYTFAPVRLPKVGANSWIHPTAMFSGPLDGIEIGSNVQIQAYAQIGNTAGSRIVIGDSTIIAPFAVLQNAVRKTSIEIGRHCSVQRYTIIYGAGAVKIGDYCRIAAHTTIIPVNKSFEDPDIPIHEQSVTSMGITLEDDIWVGSGVRILDGVTVGRGSVLAAGAVVNKSFPPMSIVGGVPGRLIGQRRAGGDPEAKMLL